MSGGGIPERWRERGPLILCASAYLWVRVLLAVSVTPTEHPDTPTYRLGVSYLGDAPRPWVVPAGLEILGDHGFVIVQTTVSAVALGALAVALARQMHSRYVGRALGTVVLLISLSPRVTTWDRMLISESLALSLTAMLLVVLLHADTVRVWVAVPIFSFWLFTRDAHFLLGIPIAVGVTAWGWRRKHWLLPALFCLSLLWAAFAAQNNQFIESFNVTANVGGRIAYDVEHSRWFSDRGMPPSDAFNIADPVQRIRQLYLDPEFRLWASEDGPRLYAQFLLSHPRQMLDGVVYMFKDVQALSAEPEAIVDHSAQFRHTTGDPPGLPFWPAQASWYTLILGCSALLTTLFTAVRGRTFDRRWIIPTAVLASSPLHAILVWVASPYEVARHGLVMSFLLVLCSFWLIALAADIEIEQRQPTCMTNGTSRPERPKPSRC